MSRQVSDEGEYEDDHGEFSAVVVDPEDLQEFYIEGDVTESDSRSTSSGSPRKMKRRRISHLGFSANKPHSSQTSASGSSTCFLKPSTIPSDRHSSTSGNIRQERRMSNPVMPASSLKTSLLRARAQSLNPAEDIRKATELYLQGELSLTDFAAAMQNFEHMSDEEESEGVTVKVESNKPHPSLVLLNPETVQDVKPTIQSGPDIGPDTDDFDNDITGPLAKLKGEFFRSGSDTATFSIRRKKKMSPTIRSMMGEAHLRYARGDLAGAESICMEVIKEQPTYKDPFHTLAMIYESQGRVNKSVQFSLICGLLDPKHFDEWPRLAELSIEEGNTAQAIMCLNKAVIADPLNFKAFIKRSELMASSGDMKGAFRGFQKALQLAESDGSVFMEVSTKLAGLYYQTGELEQAYETLSVACTKFSERITFAELNLIIELCISLKRFVRAITFFTKYSGVRFEPPIPKESFKDRLILRGVLNESNRKCVVPIGLHSDLMQKLCVVLIHLEAYEMFKPVFEKLRNAETIESFGLQFYEIAEAYIAKQQHQPALLIIDDILKSEQYMKAAEIWLRYAECLFLLNRLEESAEAYTTVIKLAPGHKIARLNLSVILQKLGKFDVALESLDHNEMESLIDQDLLVEKCNILLSRDRIPEFYETALQLFNRHCPDIKDDDEAHAIVITSYTNQQFEGLRALRHKRGDPRADEHFQFEIKPDENPFGEWKIYLSLLKLFLKKNRPDLFRRVAYRAWVSQLFCRDQRMQKDLDFHCALASILCGDTDMTPHHLRILFGRYNIPLVILNLLSLACRRCGHTRYGRQMIRLLMKHPNDPRLMILSAHTSFMTGTYKYALMEYVALVKLLPHDPLMYLMVATTLLHIAAQKQTGNRSQLMIHAITFINRYAELRGDCQETFYNLGRFYHYQGLYRQAVVYYKRVLITAPIEEVNATDFNENISDLKREAAFNLARIYKSNHCWELARSYIHKYITV